MTKIIEKEAATVLIEFRPFHLFSNSVLAWAISFAVAASSWNAAKESFNGTFPTIVTPNTPIK